VIKQLKIKLKKKINVLTHACLWGLRTSQALDCLGLDIFNNFGTRNTNHGWNGNLLVVSIFVFLHTVMVKIILQKIHMQHFSIK